MGTASVVRFLLLATLWASSFTFIKVALEGLTPSQLVLARLLLGAAVLLGLAGLRKVIGVLVGFLGVVLVIGPWRESLGSLGGQLACLGAALSYAGGFVYVRKHLSSRGLAPLSLAAAQLAAAAALQALVTPFLAWETPEPTGRVVASIVVLGLLSTGLAYVLYFRLIGDLGAATASTVNYVVPVAAVLVSVLLLGEPVTWNLLVGGLVVLGGVAYAENRLKLRRGDPATAGPGERSR
jgi:drug/metabolite transporter (DMT)-like permease